MAIFNSYVKLPEGTGGHSWNSVNWNWNMLEDDDSPWKYMMVGLAWSKSVMNHHINLQSFCTIHRLGLDLSCSIPENSPETLSTSGTQRRFYGGTPPEPALPDFHPNFRGQIAPWNVDLGWFGMIWDDLGWFGMIWEPHAGHLDIMKYLLDKRADPAAKASSVHDRKKGELVLPGVHR